MTAVSLRSITISRESGRCPLIGDDCRRSHQLSWGAAQQMRSFRIFAEANRLAEHAPLIPLWMTVFPEPAVLVPTRSREIGTPLYALSQLPSPRTSLYMPATRPRMTAGAQNHKHCQRDGAW